ncbi:NADP-dependent oxidoreductase [Salinimicrobium terrae]|uniref:NADP-dependent oxidoreductase n=1 Tax=Salinimicrobium terrae TaxID=470866 RepID=UPI00042A2F0F|nr:NADP-dependent oxidoreductase [Salinimicrobium terrae]
MKKEMKAAKYEEFGGPEKVKVGKMKIPELKEGEVLVRIKSAGVNPVDGVVLNGTYKDMMPHKLPVIPGWDMSGVIEERGHAARRFEVGDEVYAYARRPEVKWGTFAEYVVLPESCLASKPGSISFEEAAAIPLAGLTAYQALYEAGGLKEGQTVLILGASGGVGSYAIQLAKARNAKVIGVASEKNHEYMKSLGADHTIDYHDRDVGEATKEKYSDGVDLIFDCTSGKTMKQSLKALKAGGKMVSILTQKGDIEQDINFEFVFVEPNPTQLDHISKLVKDDQLKVNISKKYHLDEIGEALKQIKTLHTTGKIVLVM